MEILLSTADDELAARVSAALTAAGHTISRWQPPQPAAPTALAIVDGLRGVGRAFAAECDVLALLDEAELAELPQAPRDSVDFVLKPLRLTELIARVAELAKRPSRKERVHAALLSLAVQSAGDVIEITSPDARFEYVNPAYQQVFGYAPAEAVGRTPRELVASNYHPPEFFRDMEETLRRAETWTGVVVSKARDGRLVHLDSIITAVKGEHGQVTHHLAVKRDITERLVRQEALLEANRALIEARDAAVAASRAKSEFLANMSHELRTPLNAIIGYSEMLLEDCEPGSQQAKDLSRIRGAGTHLLALINDVLDISKIEADKVELSPESFQLSDLLEQVAATMQPLADKNGNRFYVQIAGELGAVHADRRRLRQILLNLLSNACKFTKHGKVSLHARQIEHEARPCFEIEVRDTGIGISEAQRQKLFRPFVQADSSTTREFGGTGLGLVICQRLTQMMGGEITLESAPHQGTRVTLRLPCEAEPATRAEAQRESEPAPEPRRSTAPTVLLIDDDPAARDLFVRTLAQRGFRPKVAASGREGIACAARLKPDAIVLDVKMPGLSGWEVLSALKLSEVTARIPVIMLTVMQQREIGQALGAVDYLIKPIDPANLSATLRRHIGVRAARVLVVEDDEPTRDLVRRTLEKDGNQVSEAENGQVALERLREAAPDIVVLDLMMPVMDGFTFLQHLRNDPRYARLPVVVATARELSADELRELEQLVQRVIEKNACSRRELLEALSYEIQHIVERGADPAVGAG